MFILRLMFRGNHFGLLPGEFQISWNMVGGRRWERVHGRFRQMFSKKRMLEGAGPRQKPRSNVAFQAHEKKRRCTKRAIYYKCLLFRQKCSKGKEETDA